MWLLFRDLQDLDLWIIAELTSKVKSITIFDCESLKYDKSAISIHSYLLG